MTFHVDSSEVDEAYRSKPNYLIEYSNKSPCGIEKKQAVCAIYFSSHDIYYPNTSEAFKARILEENRYEWYKARFCMAEKHIFLRDIKKQWYLTGINREMDSVEKVIRFLKKEAEGYKVFTVGSSAGGFAAVLFGQFLSAERSYSFNGQFCLIDFLRHSTEAANPVIFREQNNPSINKYYSLREYIVCPKKIFYFYSRKNKRDVFQYEHIKDLGIATIAFNTAHHGIPFPKANLSAVLSLSVERLWDITKRVHNPLIFSLRFVGVSATLKSVYLQAKKFGRKRNGANI